MFKKAVLLATATLTTVAVAGCTGSPGPSAGAPVSAPAQQSATAAPAATAGGGAGATKSPGTKPGTTKPTPASDPGDDGNWFGALKPCERGLPTEVQRLERADLTGDGVAEALVARTCEPVTSRWPSTVEVFDGTTGEKPRRLGVLLEDAGAADHPWFVSLTVSGGTVSVTAHGVSANSPLACPDLKLTYQYRYAGGKFTRTSRKATKSADCLSAS